MPREVIFKYNEKIKNEIIHFHKYFELLLKVVDMPKRWSQRIAFDLEIKKSFLRGMLRYSINSIQIQKLLIDLLKEKGSFKYKYISPIYPMIHLPGDKVEAGGFHFDDYSMKIFRTVWLPLTNYKYSSLSIFKFQNFLVDFLAKIIIKIKLPIILSDKVSSKIGDYYLWDGKRIHAGNLNHSKSISCAFQMKLSDEVYIYEPSRNINKFNSYNSKNFKNFKYNDLKKIYNQYCKNVLYLKNNLSFDKKQFNSGNLGLKPISFSYSILSQRLLSFNNYFKLRNHKEVSKIFDALSIINGSDNLISYLRLSKQKKISQDNTFKLLDEKKNNLSLSKSLQYKKIFNKKIFNKEKIYSY